MSETNSDTRIHVETSGDGPPLVFTHGFGDDASTWAAQLPVFSTRHRTLAWDLPGHGRSAKPEAQAAYSREIALARLDEVLTMAGSPAVLIGHSLGGYLSMCRVVNDAPGIAWSVSPQLVDGLIQVKRPGGRCGSLAGMFRGDGEALQ